MSTFLTTGALKEDVTAIVASASPLHLTLESPTILRVVGSLKQEVYLPNALSLEVGIHFIIVNNSTNDVDVKDYTSTPLVTLTAQAATVIYLVDASTAAGVWSQVSGNNREFSRSSIVLFNSSNDILLPDLSFPHTTYCGSRVEYSIKEASGVRVGRLLISTDGSTASIIDDLSETSDVGVNWSAAIVGDDVQILYSTTPLAGHRSMQADIKLFKI